MTGEIPIKLEEDEPYSVKVPANEEMEDDLLDPTEDVKEKEVSAI
eukprot:CAMPEP_0184871788 /NCGR_PEP_ID=MMETSP0580-20130426/40903_1 /TAXON_ID=1118495 /ORGANISM="Dactyliosolen fragilissimus" /LENGTH=44 /DNA_ID= /DNA_START= /DNA_END= /DNA_ORIENTATION=